jgi:hypothetical protein
MGLNKRYINYENTLTALKTYELNNLYGKTDLFIFEDKMSEYVYEQHIKGRTSDEIIKKLEDKKNIN